jgi:tripartite-type tricarboxylate transporter receptor subunit TctC
MNPQRRSILRLCSLAALSGRWCDAAAERYPGKPIKLVLGFPPGGAADGVARQLQAKWESLLGQPFIFEYRPGAGATIAADYVARATPDGYTLHFVESGALTIQPNARKLSYDPLASFTPVGLVAGGSVVLVAHPSVPADTVPQLIAMLKSKPGAFVYGTSGIAGFGHLAAELFQAMSHTEMIHVPYKGGAPAMIDLAGGQVPLLFASIGTSVPYIQSGKIKALGVTTAARAAALPNVPTIAEQGVAGYEFSVWMALVGPAKLPVDVVSRLSATLKDTLADTTVQAAIKRQGYEPTPSTPQQLQDRIQTDLAKWSKVIRDRKLVFD